MIDRRGMIDRLMRQEREKIYYDYIPGLPPPQEILTQQALLREAQRPRCAYCRTTIRGEKGKCVNCGAPV